MLESLFNKVAGLRPAALLKRDSNTGVLCEYYETLRTICFYRTPPMAGSDVARMFPT